MSEVSPEEATRTFEAFELELATYREGVRKLQEMDAILTKDLLDCEDWASGAETTDSGRRALVRALFALIEGSIFTMKQFALNLSEIGKGNFTRAELVMLEENTYDLDDRGRSQTQTKFIPLSKNVKFAFEATARAFDIDYSLKVSGTGWNAFQKALKIRIALPIRRKLTTCTSLCKRLKWST